MREISEHDRLRRRLRNHAGIAILAYFPVTAGVLTWMRTHPDSPFRILIALIPLVPLAFGLLVVIRIYRVSDERLRRIHMESLAFGFILSAPLVVTYGFLETGGLPKISAWWIWIVMALTWTIGRFIVVRRYR
jgi:hypothetical protein